MKHSCLSRLVIVPLVSGMALCCWTAAASDKSKPDDEKKAAEQWAKEDAESEAEDNKLRDDLGTPKKLFFTGKLTLIEPNQTPDGVAANPNVVGVFKDKDGPTYQVKLENKDLKKLVERFDGRIVSIVGRLRNNGKYLICSIVTDPNASAPALIRTRRKGT